MAEISTTIMSSKGQVVIPKDIRRRLGLRSGSQFIVVGVKDTVILKIILPPKMHEFDELVAQARKQAKGSGLKRSDVKSVISKIRTRK